MLSGWETVSGTDLHDAHVRQSPLSDFVPRAPAVYLWRRALRVPRAALRGSAELCAWLDTAMRTPVAEIRDQRLSHFAVVDQLTFRGAGFTAKKQHDLELMTSRKRREWLAKYINEMAQFAPPLYCGETADLTQRTREHLSGETGFSQRLQLAKPRLSWPDLDLAFYDLSQLQFRQETRARDLRQLLELITTAFSVAGYVSRRG